MICFRFSHFINLSAGHYPNSQLSSNWFYIYVSLKLGKVGRCYVMCVRYRNWLFYYFGAQFSVANSNALLYLQSNLGRATSQTQTLTQHQYHRAHTTTSTSHILVIETVIISTPATGFEIFSLTHLATSIN